MRILSPLVLLLSSLACYDVPTSPDVSDPNGADPIDRDGDGYAEGDDCDDGAPEINPGAAEACNGADDDCDGEVDESGDLVVYRDDDGDGYGVDSDTSTACTLPAGYVSQGGDCDDTVATINPGALEVCDGSVDENCDGSVDESGAEGAAPYAADADDDGFGDENSVVEACAQPDGYVADATDCDDADSTIYPGADERCDGAGDEDCDGEINEDSAVDVVPFAPDADGDGYGDETVTTYACSAPSGFVEDATDCDDTSALVSPASEERCDGSGDEDCDGEVDEPSAVDAATWYLDDDGDGYGALSKPVQACTQPDGATSTTDDCDDAQAAVYPGASEVCDELDNDCDGVVDFKTVVGTDYTDLIAAIDAAPTDPVCIPTGTHKLPSLISGGVKLDLQGMGAIDETVLVAEASGTPTLSVGGRNTKVVVSNVTLSGGQSPSGSGARVQNGSLVLRDVVVEDFTAATTSGDCVGAAVFNTGGQLRLDGVEVRGGDVSCPVVWGLVAAEVGTIDVDQVKIVDNNVTMSQRMGGMFYIIDSTGKLDNVVVAGNTVQPMGTGTVFIEASVGFIAGTPTNVALSNWTITGNDVYPGNPGEVAVAFWLAGPTLSMVNVHADGTAHNADSYFLHDANGMNPTLGYLNVYQFDNLSTSGIVESSPGLRSDPGGFIDVSGTVASDWDLHLSSTSALIGAGDPTILDADGTRSDIGAYGGPGGDW